MSVIRCASLLLVAAFVPTSVAHAQATVPFAYEDARVYVPVRAGTATRWFILDTGAQPTVLDDATASALGIRGRDTTQAEGAGAGRMRQSRGTEATLMVGAVALPVRQPVIAPLDSALSRYTGRRAPGIIGSQFFVGRTVTLDFDHGELFARDSVPAEELRGSTIVPLTIEGGIPYTTATLRFADREPIPAKLLVDLGAKATLLLTEPFIARAQLQAARDGGVRSSLGAGLGGETRYSFVRLASLQLTSDPATRLDSAIAGLSVGGTLRSQFADGLLGVEFLRRYRVTFDYANRRMLLRPRQPALPRDAFDMSGLFVVASGAALRTFTVSDVAAGSPAAVAGVRVGDEITAIDGRPASAITLSDLRATLRGPAGRHVELSSRRNEVAIATTITLARRV